MTDDTCDPDWQCNGCQAWLEDLAEIDAEQKLAHEEMMRGMRDANMKEAAVKITAILRHHDLMGIVLMSGKGDLCEYVTEFCPQGSCITPHDGPDGKGIRIKAKCATDSDEAAKLRASVSGLMGIKDVMRHVLSILEGLLTSLGKHMEILHHTRVNHPDESAN
jgi:hypothetical protein